MGTDADAVAVKPAVFACFLTLFRVLGLPDFSFCNTGSATLDPRPMKFADFNARGGTGLQGKGCRDFDRPSPVIGPKTKKDVQS